MTITAANNAYAIDAGSVDEIATRAADSASTPNMSGEPPVHVSINVGMVLTSTNDSDIHFCGMPGIHGTSVTNASTTCSQTGSQEPPWISATTRTKAANAPAPQYTQTGMPFGGCTRPRTAPRTFFPTPFPTPPSAPSKLVSDDTTERS